MNKLISVLFLFFLIVSPSQGFSETDFRSNSLLDQDARFLSAFQRTVKKLDQALSGRLFRIRAMNESLSFTKKSAQMLLQRDDLKQIIQNAKEAQRKYPENSFALLIEALALDEQGSPEAIQTFQDYLVQSDHHTKFESSFLNSVNFHEMRRGILKYLESKGIKTEIFKSKSIFNMNWGRFFESPASKYIYLIAFALLGGTLLLFLYGILRKIWGRYKPVEKGYKRCKKCGAINPALMLECSECGTKFLK